MNKYLTFNTTAGVHNVPIGNGLYAEKISDTETRLYNADAFLYHYALTTSGGAVATAELTVNIMAALERASATTWQNAEVEVNLPASAVVASIALTIFS
tara:strand:- start:78 stop:374 length:297 start_codon:yes stop_codon:yes gene_type:complete